MERPDRLTQVVAFSVDPTLDTTDFLADCFAYSKETLPLPGAEIVEVTALDWVPACPCGKAEPGASAKLSVATMDVVDSRRGGLRTRRTSGRSGGV